MSEESLIRIVDDDEELLKAIKFSLELDGWNVAIYNSGEAFLENDDFEVPGCLVLDYEMPGMTGGELQSMLIEREIALPVIFLTAHAEVNMVIKAFKNGAYDFLTKPLDPELFSMTVIKAIDKHKKVLSELKAMSPANRFSLLNDRQKQVARLIARNLTCAVIGERLGKSGRTIERHRSNILHHMGVRTAKELKDLLVSIGGY